MRHHSAHRRGSAMTMAIVMAIVLTGLICALAWTTGEETQRAGSLRQVDQAFFAAEAGAQRVQWYCKNGQITSLTPPLKGSLNGYAYSVSWQGLPGLSVAVQSTGSAGNVSYLLSERVTPPSSAPLLAAGGSFDNKNIDIYGDIMVNTYDNAGGGSLHGNLTYFTTVANTGSVTGKIRKSIGTFAPIDFDALGNTLIAAAGKTYTGDQANVTFDFTTLPGPNRVIYVAGNVTYPTFNGTGTLYASGSVTFANAGTAANPVNIVAKGDITTDQNSTVYGSLYTNGTWYRGKFALTGLVYATKDIFASPYAQSTLNAAAPPWFDPRASSWSPLTSVANFSGPQP